jgi:hypothetical protein
MFQSHSPSHTSISGSLPGRARNILGWLDQACLLLSPLALLVLVVLGIFALDYWGSHRAMLRALDDYGYETLGYISAYDGPGDDSLIVKFDMAENGQDYAFLYTRYYSPATLEKLHNGRWVRVRYTTPEHGGHAALADWYGEVRQYPGVLQGLEWVLGLCLLVLVVRPDILFLGLGEPHSQPGRADMKEEAPL